MEPGTELQERVNAVTVQLLLIDAEMALTMLDAADTTRLAENRIRGRAEARKAYDTILRLVENVEMNDEQRLLLETRLNELCRRLSGRA